MKPFDSLAYAKALARGGIPQQQAIAQSEALSGVIFDTLVTKIDLDHAIEILRRDLTIRIGGMIVALGSILVAIKYFG